MGGGRGQTGLFRLWCQPPPRPMPNRQTLWSRVARNRLRDALGRACAACGGKDDLEFDCIKPQGDSHHRVGILGRTCFYRQQHAQGNLQLLCSRCHLIKSICDSSGNYQSWHQWLVEVGALDSGCATLPAVPRCSSKSWRWGPFSWLDTEQHSPHSDRPQPYRGTHRHRSHE